MPVTNLVADSLGVLTICLVGLLTLLGLFCILYSLYFNRQIHYHGYIELSYFTGPWIVRIAFILFVILWGFGEILRLSILRRKGRILNAVGIEWQERVCKGYIISNLGFAEPCLLLTLAFLLRASLQIDLEMSSRKWNGKTVAFILLYCFPLLVLQLTVVLIGMQKVILHNLPSEFTLTNTKVQEHDDTIIALCTYPLLSILLIGVFILIMTTYFVCIGRRIVKHVINKGLRKRVYMLMLSILSLFPMRILFLSLSVIISQPEEPLFEAFSFLGFLSLHLCAVVNMLVLVYYPIADSLALRQRQSYQPSLIVNQTRSDEETGNHERNCNNSRQEEEDDESITFCARNEDDNGGSYVELGIFCQSDHGSPLGSPQPFGWPIIPSTAITPLHG